LKAGAVHEVVYDGTSFQLLGTTKLQGMSWWKGLKVTTTGAGNSQSVVVTADTVQVIDTTNILIVISAFSGACDLSTAGANGLDTGSLAANTGYFLWLIHNGTSTATLASVSATAPTMPATYTYKALLGWFTTDATTTPFNIEEFTQVDDIFTYHTSHQFAIINSTNTVAVQFGPASGYLTFDALPATAKSAFVKAWRTPGGYDSYLDPRTFGNNIGGGNYTAAFAIAPDGNLQVTEIPIEEANTIYIQGVSVSRFYVCGFRFRR
jgi:hypothetical protein